MTVFLQCSTYGSIGIAQVKYMLFKQRTVYPTNIVGFDIENKMFKIGICCMYCDNNNSALTCDFQQCSILTSVDLYKPM